jgi:hypothetical protein
LVDYRYGVQKTALFYATTPRLVNVSTAYFVARGFCRVDADRTSNSTGRGELETDQL